MKKEFIPYEQALELKKLGFDELCLAYYDEKLYFPHNDNIYGKFCNQPKDIPSCSAPLYQQAFRWFREKYGLYSEICVDQTMEPLFCYSLSKYKGDFQWDNILPAYSELYYTYEEAELACLKKLIEISKNQ